jgi:hypothetical protein
MSKKSSASAAQTTLEEMQSLSQPTPQERPLTPEDFTSSAESYDGGSDEMESLGDRVSVYYVHKLKPGKELKQNQAIIQAGQTFSGIYNGSRVSEQSRFKSRTHFLRIVGGEKDGSIIGLPSCGLLDKRFQFVPKGTKTEVRYDGSNVIKTGQWAGSDSYLYDVKIGKSVNRAIQAGTLPAQYELKDKNN